MSLGVILLLHDFSRTAVFDFPLGLFSVKFFVTKYCQAKLLSHGVGLKSNHSFLHKRCSSNQPLSHRHVMSHSGQVAIVDLTVSG